MSLCIFSAWASVPYLKQSLWFLFTTPLIHVTIQTSLTQIVKVYFLLKINSFDQIIKINGVQNQLYQFCTALEYNKILNFRISTPTRTNL